jgi:plasmid stability protein
VTSLTIRRLDEGLKQRLRLRAANHGRSMEEEVRVILKTALNSDAPARLNLAESIRRHIAPIGGVELKFEPREPIRRPPKFSK